jgi:hypothetical protein
MSPDAATQEAPAEKSSEGQRSKQESPPTVEVEINGKKVQAQQQTVPTGAGSIMHFVSGLLHRA